MKLFVVCCNVCLPFVLQKSDSSLLAQFYYADEELNMVATELDSFDGRKDPERCATLVNQLRVCQDKVLTHIQKIMDQAIDVQRANRDFRVKFPDDVLQESLGGQLWFGAEVGVMQSSSVQFYFIVAWNILTKNFLYCLANAICSATALDEWVRIKSLKYIKQPDRNEISSCPALSGLSK